MLSFAIAFVLAFALGALISRYAVRHSVEGYEDESGFHLGAVPRNPVIAVQVDSSNTALMPASPVCAKSATAQDGVAATLAQGEDAGAR